MPYKGSYRKKRKTHQLKKEIPNIPKSFVFSRGVVSMSVKKLVLDVRKMLIPNTADKLNVKRNNKLKDFLHVAGPLGVTHFWIYSQSDFGVNLRLVRIPHGPTLTFRIEHFSLMKDVVSLQKRPENTSNFFDPPIIILENFKDDPNHQLMSAMFQNLFPAIKVKTIRLSQCNRVCLFEYNKNTDTIQVRHYRIKISDIALNRRIKHLIHGKKIPSLKKYRDISDYVNDLCYPSSATELDDIEEGKLILKTYKFGKEKKKSGKSKIRLKEIGPRLTIKLLKIEEELDGRKLIYSRYHSRSKKEKKLI